MGRFAGIDIGARHVRVAIVRTAYRRVTIEAMLEAPLTDTTSPSATLQALLGKTRADGVAIALPGDRCFYRRMELPATALKELDSVLAFELESSIPFELEGAVYDHRVLRRAVGAPDGDQLVVFAAIARIEDVRGRMDVVKDATGREPDSVDTGSITLANLATVVPELTPLATAAGPAQPVAVLDLGGQRSELVILEGGQPSFARAVTQGTDGISEVSAHAMARDLKQSFAAWRADGGAPLGALYLVGDGAGVRGAEAFLSGVLELPVKQLPRMRVDVPPADEAKLPSFAKAISLALSNEKSRSLNLRQGPLEVARSFAFLREKLPLLSGLAAVILVSFGFSLVAEMRALSSERALLDEQLKATTREVFGQETADVTAANALLEKGPASDGNPYPGVDAFDVMVQLSKAVPAGVVHDVAELDVSRGHAIIQGLVPDGTDAQKTAETIADGMKQHPCLKNVKIARVTQAGPEKQKYILEMDLQCEDKKKKAEPAKKDDKEGTP